MSEQYNRSPSTTSTPKNVTLVEFVSWPPGRRESFVRSELSGSPAFIVEALLRVA